MRPSSFIISMTPIRTVTFKVTSIPCTQGKEVLGTKTIQNSGRGEKSRSYSKMASKKKEKKKKKRPISGCPQLRNRRGNVRTRQVIPGGSRTSGQHNRLGLGKNGSLGSSESQAMFERRMSPRTSHLQSTFNVLRPATQQTHKVSIMHD